MPRKPGRKYPSDVNRGDDPAQVTTTFTDAAGVMMTRCGVGRYMPQAKDDARAQLPYAFEPVSEYHSTRASILASLQDRRSLCTCHVPA